MINFKNLVKLFFNRKSASYSPDGQLHIPSVNIMVEGQRKTYEVIMKIISDNPLQFEVININPQLPGYESLSSTMASQSRRDSFICNICGKKNRNVDINVIRDRESPSCKYCGSSLRMRSVIYALSNALFHKSLILPDFPKDKSICGVGMSDWKGYAIPLAKKFKYINTFYHKKPHLDIMNIDDEKEDKLDFIISSDVFEHIFPPVSIAFENTFKLLKPGGVLILTVPFTLEGNTVEHFPNLHDYRIENKHGCRVLVNTTETGEEEIFDNLIFHGGDGFTLELRMFSESGLMDELKAAGFKDIYVQREDYSEFGIIWPITWAVPIIAKKPL